MGRAVARAGLALDHASNPRVMLVTRTATLSLPSLFRPSYSAHYSCRYGTQHLQLILHGKRTMCGGQRRVRTNHFQNNVGLPAIMAVVVGMVGVTYISVPLYQLFCQATGFGGTTKKSHSIEEVVAKTSKQPSENANMRELTIHFNADVSEHLNWKFTPSQNFVRVIPGETALAFYKAKNCSGKDVIGISTYNVTPPQAGNYFNKIQCFCFEEQMLRKDEEIDMPVFFFIDPEFAEDPKMDGVNHITLSYTFFASSDQSISPLLTPNAGRAVPYHQKPKLAA